MNITLESRVCPCCKQENSIHINDCHACGAVLPWAEGAVARAKQDMIHPMVSFSEAESHDSVPSPETSFHFLVRPISFVLERLYG